MPEAADASVFCRPSFLKKNDEIKLNTLLSPQQVFLADILEFCLYSSYTALQNLASIYAQTKTLSPKDMLFKLEVFDGSGVS